MRKKPNLFIIGQPKSGTSALWAFLAEHPDVCMGTTKEPQYFCKDFRSQYFDLEKWQRTEKNYFRLFADCQDAKVIGEASTAYLYSRVAAQEIHAFNPDAKIIGMLREPVDFLHTYHLQLLRTSVPFENVEDFAAALTLEEVRKGSMNVPQNCFESQFLFYSERIKYVEHLQRFYDVFSENQIKVIIHDDFRNDNARVYTETLEFLGLDTAFQPAFRTVNPKVKVRFRRAKQVTDRVLFPAKQRLKPILPVALYRAIRSAYRGIMFSHDTPELDAGLRQALKARYKGEVVKLSEFLDRDLVKLWGYDKV